MEFNDNLKTHLDLQGHMNARASTFPGSDASPYVKDVKAELKRICDWLCEQQIEEGLWPENRINLRFYSDAYAVRTLLAAAHLTMCPICRERAAELEGVEAFVREQLHRSGRPLHDIYPPTEEMYRAYRDSRQ